METESQDFNEGDEVVTSRWMRETVKSKYPKYNTYRCNTDDYLFESYQLHKAVSFDLTKIYNRVIEFNEDDETTKISLIERNFKSIVAMLQKHSKNGELHITVETKGDSIKLVDGCLVINNYI